MVHQKIKKQKWEGKVNQLADNKWACDFVIEKALEIKNQVLENDLESLVKFLIRKSDIHSSDS